MEYGNRSTGDPDIRVCRQGLLKTVVNMFKKKDRRKK